MKNIILIGMPAVGKSTLGVILAKALGFDFVDTDLLIQKSQGKRLQNIIDNDGIDRFLQIEEKVLCDLDLTGCIIATGGSVVYSEKAMEHLKQMGYIVYLSATCEEIEKRLKNITTRGIVMGKGSTLKEVYDKRVPLYENYADTVINCTGKNMEQCVGMIVKSVGNPKNS